MLDSVFFSEFYRFFVLSNVTFPNILSIFFDTICLNILLFSSYSTEGEQYLDRLSAITFFCPCRCVAYSQIEQYSHQLHMHAVCNLSTLIRFDTTQLVHVGYRSHTICNNKNCAVCFTKYFNPKKIPKSSFALYGIRIGVSPIFPQLSSSYECSLTSVGIVQGQVRITSFDPIYRGWGILFPQEQVLNSLRFFLCLLLACQCGHIQPL